jgi:lysophospholipase L1-like esterase
MNTKPGELVAAIALLVVPMGVARGEWRGGIGVLGDSYSDEYQFYPPHRSSALNWIEILATTRRLNFGEFSGASRDEPRNQGFAYNWARSDATTEDMIATGQHTGLAAQVARGEVSLAVIFIGGNDFINAMKTPNPSATLLRVGPRAEANLELAVDTILAASPEIKLVLATVPDIRNLPEFREPLRSGQLSRAYADAATATIARFNAKVRSLAARDRRVALLDLDLTTRIGDWISPETLRIAGRTIVRTGPSNEPDHLFLADVRHLGTVGQGMLAQLFVATINVRFDAGVQPLLEREILEIATSRPWTPPQLTASP